MTEDDLFLMHENLSPWVERAWVGLLQIAPLRTYTRLVKIVAGIPLPVTLRAPVFGRIAARLGMDLSEAEHVVSEYRSFGDLFVRRLKQDLRPIGSSAGSVISPVDGRLSAFGMAQNGGLIQAKGILYPLADLVDSIELAKELDGGCYITIYLRPKDYHRIHSPISGRVVELRHVKGTLMPVKPYMVRNFRGLFVRNERVIIEMETAAGKMAVVCVGAAGVGNITTRLVNGKSWRSPFITDIHVSKGEEVAAFNLGSTVILVFSPDAVTLDSLVLDQEIRMGQTLAKTVE